MHKSKSTMPELTQKHSYTPCYQMLTHVEIVMFLDSQLKKLMSGLVIVRLGDTRSFKVVQVDDLVVVKMCTRGCNTHLF